MNKTLWQYYVDTAAEVTGRALEDIGTLQQWEQERPRRREEFLLSMGLQGVPPCDLAVKCYGEFSGRGFRALRLAYQIVPDAWGTGNLYLPDPLPAGRLPAVLHVCGHMASGVGDQAPAIAAWARRGYPSFVVDTIAQTDNTGFHRGVISGARLDWISRGYSGAGGELLNGLRALEVLRARAEVDPERIGVTGASGGGAQSFFIAVADERIKAAVPMVGVASLASTLGNRIFGKHCDCMYALGLFQRDNADFAALIAPRPLLLCYGEFDELYAPQEYRTLADKARRIYRLYGREEHCRLLDYPGDHGTREPRTTESYRWMDEHVAGESRPIEPTLETHIREPQASVFNGQRPVPDRVPLLPELLTTTASWPLPKDAQKWPAIRAKAIASLRNGPLAWLDRTDETLLMEHRCHHTHRGEMGGMELWLEAPSPPASSKAVRRRLILGVCNRTQDMGGLLSELGELFPGEAIAALEPRATGLNAPAMDDVTRPLIRAGELLGLTLQLLWMNDLRHVTRYLRGLPSHQDFALYLYGKGEAAVACLYHAILDDSIAGVFLDQPPGSHLDGGYLPAILREMDITTAVGLLAPRPVGVACSDRFSAWWALRWGHRVYHRLGVPALHALSGRIDGVRAAVLGG